MRPEDAKTSLTRGVCQGGKGYGMLLFSTKVSHTPSLLSKQKRAFAFVLLGTTRTTCSPQRAQERGKQDSASPLAETRLAGIEETGTLLQHAPCWSQKQPKRCGLSVYILDPPAGG